MAQCTLANVLPRGPQDLERGQWLANLLREGWLDLTPFLLAGLVAATIVHRRAARLRDVRAGFRGTTVLVALHLVSLPLLGALSAWGTEAQYQNLRIISVAMAVLAAINIALTLTFDGLLRLLKIDTPRILIDVLAGAAYVFAAILLLSMRGVNLSGLIATSAVLTAVIGFSLQDTLGNLMGGLALQMDKSIQPGEWIEFGGRSGRITEIRWRQTSIETRDWQTVVIPNSLLAKSEISVLGRRQLAPVQLRRAMTFNVDYRHRPGEVIATITGALRGASIVGMASEPQPDCVLSDMLQSYNTYNVRYWLADISRLEAIDSAVRIRIHYALERAEIPMGVPVQALYVTNEDEERQQRQLATRRRQRQEALRSVELFHGLDDECVDELAAAMRFAPYSAGETLTRQGDRGHELFLIAHGTVAIRVEVDGVVHQLATLEAGSFFGERSLITGEARTATTVALTDVQCYLLAKEPLEQVLRRQPELAEQLAEALARRDRQIDSVRRDADAARTHVQTQSDKIHLLGKIRGFFGI